MKINESDEISKARKRWKNELPKLDTEPMETIGRILRIEFLFRVRMRRTLAKYGVDLGGLDVLATLRRSGSPYQMTPTRLYQELLLTSGAMTHRMDALEKAGLLERRPDPEDRRSMMACLSSKGREIIENIMSDHMANEAALATCLTGEEQQLLAKLLKKILLDMEKGS